ncbi:putative dihydrolipoyllysine-residue acetyltransferase [Helianthus annuus]|nr:putative dihydrolipoyllysine-residue acetyltransferase [Helianthus annuus]
MNVICDFQAVVAPIDSVAEPAVDEQPDGRLYKFVRMASTNFRLPDNVSRMAKLDSDFKPITVRLLHLTQQQEFTNRTRRENKEKGVRYALCRWSRFMKLALRWISTKVNGAHNYRTNGSHRHRAFSLYLPLSTSPPSLTVDHRMLLQSDVPVPLPLYDLPAWSKFSCGESTISAATAPWTFTLSNLGMFGVDRFDAILPPGQGAIMAVGASKPTSIADKDGYFSVKSQMLHFNWSSQTWYLLYSTSFSSHKLAKTR